MSWKTICASEDEYMSQNTMLCFYGYFLLYLIFSDPVLRDHRQMIL